MSEISELISSEELLRSSFVYLFTSHIKYLLVLVSVAQPHTCFMNCRITIPVTTRNADGTKLQSAGRQTWSTALGVL